MDDPLDISPVDIGLAGGVDHGRESTHFDHDQEPARHPKIRLRRGLLAVLVLVALVLTGIAVGRSGNDRSAASAAEPTAGSTPAAAPGNSERSSTDNDTATTPPAPPLAAVDAVTISDLNDRLIIVDGPDHLVALDFQEGTRTAVATPEQLAHAHPVRIDDAFVILGATHAWITSPEEAGWSKLGPADRIRYSTISDRVWLRSINDKTDPTDAEFLWNEVDFTGTVERSMFRNRPVWFPTPEFILGLGSNIFRFTEAEVNPWRLFSPFGVPMAVGRNDLIAKECNTRLECENVWYDVISGDPRPGIYQDLANQIDGSYGTLLSPDGRFLISELRRPNAASLAFIRSAATGQVVANNCLWETSIAWSSRSELLACRTIDGIELHETSARDTAAPTGQNAAEPLARIAVQAAPADVAFSFASGDTSFTPLLPPE